MPRAELYLVVVSLLWGTTFPIIRLAVRTVDPDVFVLLRFALASLVLMPFLLARPVDRAAWRRSSRPGMLLGALFWLAYATQTRGLQTVEAARAAFLAATTVVLVPLLAPLFGSRAPERGTVLAALVALAGVLVLVNPDLGGGLSVGDGLVLACAVVVATHVLLLQRVLRSGHDPLVLVFLQIVCIGLCSGAALCFSAPPRWHGEALGAIAFCAVFATAIPLVLQARYQPRTTAHRAALIFGLEAVFAAAFSTLLLEEPWHLHTAVGGALVVGAILVPPLLASRRAARRGPVSGQHMLAALLLLTPLACASQRTDVEEPLAVMPLLLDHHQPYVEVRIGEQGPFLFLIDTGASVSCIDTELAERLRLQVEEDVEVGDGSGDNTLTLSSGRLDALSVGAATFRDVPVIVGAFGRHLDGGRERLGILGLPFFAELLLTIDYPSRRLELSRGALSPDAEGTSRMRAEGLPDEILIDLQVGDVEIAAVVDTGSTSALALPRSAIGSIPIVGEPVVAGEARTATNTYPVYRVQLDASVRVAGHALERPSVLLNEHHDVAIVGSALLKDYRLVVDLQRGLLRLDPAP